jgi:hypothetical protein
MRIAGCRSRNRTIRNPNSESDVCPPLAGVGGGKERRKSEYAAGSEVFKDNKKVEEVDHGK